VRSCHALLTCLCAARSAWQHRLSCPAALRLVTNDAMNGTCASRCKYGAAVNRLPLQSATWHDSAGQSADHDSTSAGSARNDVICALSLCSLQTIRPQETIRQALTVAWELELPSQHVLGLAITDPFLTSCTRTACAAGSIPAPGKFVPRHTAQFSGVLQHRAAAGAVVVRKVEDVPG
jgi:hypothetical protein